MAWSWVNLVRGPSDLSTCPPAEQPGQVDMSVAPFTNVERQCSAAANDEEFDERAAIIEHDGGIPREWAEGYARLDPEMPPRGVPMLRWQAVVDAIGRFLDLWAAEASAQGWTAADLFGADAVRPGSSWLNAGPLWSGNGAEVVAVMPDKIEFSMPDGSRQFHYRRPHLRPRILPWEFAA